MNRAILYRDADLGGIYVPESWGRGLSLPGRPTRHAGPGERGLVVAKQFRGKELLWHSITENERVDAGAAIQANRLYGTSGTTCNGVLTGLAVANASFSKTHTDLSIGSASASVTTSEFTTNGLARAAATVGTYTAPASLGAQYSQVLSKVFTASGSGGTAYGAALFDSLTPSGSNLYVEDLFSSTAVLVSGDTLAISWSLSN